LQISYDFLCFIKIDPFIPHHNKLCQSHSQRISRIDFKQTSKHHHMIHKISSILMHQYHFRDKLARCFRECLLPYKRRRVRAAEDGDGGAGGEVAFFRLVLLADALKIVRCDDGFQPSGEIAHVPGVVELG